MRARKHPPVRHFEHGGARVEVVPLEGAARLVTVRPSDPMRDVAGAIVKVVPAAADSPEQRLETLALVKRAGARHAWLAPPDAAAQAVAEDRREPDAPEEPARAVVERMVAEAHTRDRPRLEAVVQAALAAVGA